MKILWLINIPIPEASQLMGEKTSPYGGWLINASRKLAIKDDIELSIAFPSKKANIYKELKGNRINYYPFMPIKDSDYKVIENNESFEKILKKIKPDIVHIYGTEMPHTLSLINTCNKLNTKTVISIQGLVSIIEKHMYANLPTYVIYGNTFRNILRQDSIYDLKKLYKNRGKYEIEALKKTKHIIGRTTWDKVCSNQINSEARYYFCNETLREEFYKYQWNINDCEKYSIFISQGQYPIKGLHYMLEAMPLILKKFPESKLYVSGKNIIKTDSIKDKLLMTYYGKYIKNIIKKLGLNNNVIFTGPLDEQKMCKRYLKSHIFVCPSTIENSPNSLGEAMILGVPIVASYVGGIPDMLKNKEEGFLYQHDAPYMLAHYVCEIFENDDLALKFSKNAREHAWTTHDSEANTRELIKIYNQIINDDF